MPHRSHDERPRPADSERLAGNRRTQGGRAGSPRKGLPSGDKSPIRRSLPPLEQLIFGRKVVAELLHHSPRRIKKLFFGTGKGLSELRSTAAKCGIEWDDLGEQATEELTEVGGGHHQGVAAWVGAPVETPLEKILDTLRGKQSALLVVLDQVTDPQNLGAILRVSECAGADAVIITADNSAPVSSTVRRVSLGASELIPIAVVKNLQRTLSAIREAGLWIVGTAVEPSSQSIYSTPVNLPAALVFGSEEAGVRRLTARECDALVHVPMAGRLESLNVSHAAAVVLFEYVRRGRESAQS